MSAVEELRITPAYAGKRNAHDQRVGGHQDHPRVCGEKFCTTAKMPRRRGSPPPYAGKSTLSTVHDAIVEDHPRVCGEKPLPLELVQLLVGITPAYAGKRNMT